MPVDDLPGWLPVWCLDHLGSRPVGTLFPGARPLTPVIGVGPLAVHAEEFRPGGEVLRGDSPEVAVQLTTSAGRRCTAYTAVSGKALRVQATERLRRANA